MGTTNAGAINYNQSPPTSYGSGTLIAVDWQFQANWRAACDTIRNAGGEILQYTLPNHDYPTRSTLQVAYYGSTRTVTQSNGWYWDNGNPSRATVPNYNGYIMDLRPGSAWILHVVQYCKDRMADANWRCDGFFLDTVGDGYTGFTSGLSAAELTTFKQGQADLCSRLRTALGDNIILMANNFWDTVNPWVDGICIEHHDDAITSSGAAGYVDTTFARMTRTKRRRNMIISSSNGAACNWKNNSYATHITVQTSYSVAPPLPQAGCSIGNGGWSNPQIPGHITLYNSTTDSSGGGGGGGGSTPPPVTPPPTQTGYKSKALMPIGTYDFNRGHFSSGFTSADLTRIGGLWSGDWGGVTKTDAATIAQTLHAAGMEVIGYIDAASVSVANGGGATTLPPSGGEGWWDFAVMRNTPAMFLKDTSGNYVYCWGRGANPATNDARLAIDPSSSALQTYFQGRVQAAKANGLQGILLDDAYPIVEKTSGTIFAGYNPRDSRTNLSYTDAAWAGDMQAMADYVRAQGLKVYGNDFDGWSDPVNGNNGIYTAFNAHFSGGILEAGYYNSGGGNLTPGQWLNVQNWLKKLMDIGWVVMPNSYKTDFQSMMLMLSSMALVKPPTTTSAAGAGLKLSHSGYTLIGSAAATYWPGFDLDIGTPLTDQVSNANGTYQRQFTNGFACTNPTAGTQLVTLPKALHQLQTDGTVNATTATQVNLVAYSGAVFQDDTTGSTPPSGLGTAPDAAGVRIGNATAGGTAGTASAGRMRGNKFTFPNPVTIPRMVVGLDGLVPGATGTQQLKVVVYADSGNNPAAKVGETNIVTINAGQSPGWVNFTFASPLALSTGQSLWFELFSGTNAITRYYFDTVTGASRAINATFPTAPDPGTGMATEDANLSMYAVIQTSAAITRFTSSVFNKPWPYDSARLPWFPANDWYNLGLPSALALDANSASMAAAILNLGAPHFAEDIEGPAIYETFTSDASLPIYLTGSSASGYTSHPTVHYPQGGAPPGEATGGNNVAIIDQNKVHSFAGTSPFPDSASHLAAISAARSDLTVNSTAEATFLPGGWGSSISMLGGTIVPEDIEYFQRTGKARHALSMYLPPALIGGSGQVAGTDFIDPAASTTGSQGFATNRILEGMRVRLPSSVDPNAYTTSNSLNQTFVRYFITALRDFGAILVAGTSTIFTEFAMAHPKAWTTFGFTDPWPTTAGPYNSDPTQPNHNFLLNNTPFLNIWNQLQVIGRGTLKSQLINFSTIDSTAPLAFINLTGQVSGTSVSLTWSLPTDPDRVTWEIRRKSTPWTSTDLPTVGTLVTNSSINPSQPYIDAGVPAGPWYYKPFTADAVGNIQLSQPIYQVTIVTGGPVVGDPYFVDTYTGVGQIPDAAKYDTVRQLVTGPSVAVIGQSGTDTYIDMTITPSSTS